MFYIKKTSRVQSALIQQRECSDFLFCNICLSTLYFNICSLELSNFLPRLSLVAVEKSTLISLNVLFFNSSLPLLYFFSESLMSVLCFLRLPASDGGWAAPVSVWLSAGPGCQHTAGDPWPLRLLWHPGAAKCQRGKCSLFLYLFHLWSFCASVIFGLEHKKISLNPSSERAPFQPVGLLR